MRSWLNTIVVGAVILMAAFLATPTLATESIQVTRGNFVTYAAGLEEGYTISGQAKMVRSAEGHTTLTVRVQGLAPNISYEVNVHNQACSNQAGGGLYQHEIGGAVDNANKIWQVMTTRSNGYGYSKIVNDFVARSEARSVVIHNTDNMRLACADLNSIAVSPYTLGTKQIEELGAINTMAASWDQAKRLSNPTTTQLAELAAFYAYETDVQRAVEADAARYTGLAAFYTNEPNARRIVEANAARYTGLASIYAMTASWDRAKRLSNSTHTLGTTQPVSDIEFLRRNNPNYFHPGR